MMNGILLLFGFDLLPKILLVHGVMVRLGIKVLVVPRKDYQVSMEGLLAGEHGDYDGPALGGRMIVLCWTRHWIPSGLRESGRIV